MLSLKYLCKHPPPQHLLSCCFQFDFPAALPVLAFNVGTWKDIDIKRVTMIISIYWHCYETFCLVRSWVGIKCLGFYSASEKLFRKTGNKIMGGKVD